MFHMANTVKRNRNLDRGALQDFCQTFELAATESAADVSAQCQVLDAIDSNQETRGRELTLKGKLL